MRTYRVSMQLDGRLNVSTFRVYVDSFDEAYQQAMKVANEFKGSRITKMNIQEVE